MQNHIGRHKEKPESADVPLRAKKWRSPPMLTDIDSENTPKSSTDRRRHPRYRFSIPLTIRLADGVVVRGVSIEISASGMSAITANSLKLNELAELEPIAGGRVQAQVRHNIGKVYGFEFLNLTAEQTQQITERCKLLPRYQGNTLGI
jgi:PilZ domain